MIAHPRNYLALVTDAYGGRGGIAQYNRDFFDVLAQCVSTSSVVVLPRVARDAAGRLSGRVVQLPATAGRSRYVVAALRAALCGRVDVVFCGHVHLAPLALAASRVARAKLVVQAHGTEVSRSPSRLRRAAVEAADLVLCVSRHTRASVLNWAAKAPERVVVVPDTVGDDFCPGDASQLRSAWGLIGKRVLLTVGRMDARERYKGHDVVIAAMADFPAELHDATYVIIGEGDDRGRLEEMVRKAGVEDRVRFMGALDRRMLIDAYRMADLFVMPSKREGFGIAFLEAMACGTPALGLAEAGARDALGDGELGVLATAAELPQKVIRLLTAPKPDRDRLAAKVRARFGRAVFAAQLSAVFDRMAAV